MTRVERARLILSEVWHWDKITGTFSYWHHGKSRLIMAPGWEARIHGPFNPAPGAYGRNIKGTWVADPETRLSVWLSDGPKVLTIIWSPDTFRIVTMRRGDWEADLFRLPPYEGCALPMYYRGRPRSRRW